MDDISLTIEQELLGRLLDTPEVLPVVANTLEPRHFQEEAHARLFQAMLKRHAASTSFTFSTLAADLNTDWRAPLIEGLSYGQYVARLMTSPAPTMMLKAYAADLRSQWAIRTITGAAGRVSSDQGIPTDRLQMLMQEIDEVRAALVESTTTRETAGETGASVVERVNAIRMGELATVGASTGFRELDRLTLGYRPGELVVVGARPGIGKTTFGSSSGRQSAAAGNGVAFFSLELAKDAIGARLLADQAFDKGQRLTHSAIRDGHLSDAQFEHMMAAEAEVARLPMDCDYAARLTVPELSARVSATKKRMARSGIPLRVVFIDYLKQVRASDRYRGQRHYEVGEITAGLHEIAKREEVCIVLLAQLNRGIEAESNKRPDLHHLRESGDIEADADVVLFLYRPAYYLRRTKEFQEGAPDALAEVERFETKLEVIVAKNRNGETGIVDLFCDIGASAVRNGGTRYGEHRQ
ncbi:replicative DNA helicase [Azorhizobium oxalatiphilum]|uniref:DNA 5'-3' helicase n=1 Tax=Azorhizobium oxalatiphilum TaxID=980631 RepID=A0A917FHQ5_9HYPH|nr:DnaB-like helicase C-terminal domain-containing protein [Azorhizobium oxalatiphilum]GGF82147.1 replicative DNA helicase [Azorhizobium oxalatiphilum]